MVGRGAGLPIVDNTAFAGVAASVTRALPFECCPFRTVVVLLPGTVVSLRSALKLFVVIKLASVGVVGIGLLATSRRREAGGEVVSNVVG